jgi:hypothetical protein
MVVELTWHLDLLAILPAFVERLDVILFYFVPSPVLKP